MAARLAALALVCQLLLAAGVAAVLAFGFELRTLPTVAATLAAFYGIALLLVAFPLAVAPRPDPQGRLHRPQGSAPRRLRSLAREALVFDLIWASMVLEPFRASPIAAPGATARRRPVLLVHGFACNRAVWRPFLERLSRAGFGPLRTVSLEPVFASVETCVAALLGELESLVEKEPAAIVAHSMGGLVARAALRRARPGLIGRIITIGAPHHGTTVACLFRWPSALQMCPGSRWLDDLNASQEGHWAVPVTTLYSLEDNLILPAISARLEGARAHELRGLGHLTLLRSPQVFDRVVSELLLPGAGSAGSRVETG